MPVQRPPVAKPKKAAHVQSELVASAAKLDLVHTQALCANAALQPDLPSFVKALAEALRKDADSQEQARWKQQGKAAGLPFPSAHASTFETGPGRGLAKLELDGLSQCRWVKERQNLLIQGATQTGKTRLACVLAREALGRGYSVMYRTTEALLREWFESREHLPTLQALRTRTREVDLLVLDNFGEGNAHRHDLGPLREIVTERFDEDGKSLCIVSSGDADAWKSWMGDADEIRAVSARIESSYIKVGLLRGALPSKVVAG